MAVLLGACGGPGTDGHVTGTTTADVGATAGPVDVGPGSWREEAVESPAGELATIWSIASTTRGWVLAGSSQTDPAGESVATLWSSGDGRRWTDLARPGGTTPSRSSRAMQVAGSGSGLVAAGTIDGEGDRRIAVWPEQDGGWGAPVELEGSDGVENVTGLVATDRGLVVSGSDGAHPSADPQLWFSPDGRRWERPDRFDWRSGQPLSRRSQAIQSLAASPDVMVAVGYEDDGLDLASPVAWSSKDGRTWQRETIEDAPGGGHDAVLGVTWTGREFVAVGSVDDNRAVWTSGDGGSWRRAADPEVPEGTVLTAVRAVEDGALVFGGSSSESRLLVREHSGRWRDVDLPPAPGPVEVMPSLLASDGTQIVIASPTRQEQLVWHSPAPGAPWVRADTDVLPRMRRNLSGMVTGLAARGDVVVATGMTRVRDGSSGEMASSAGRIWYRKGQEWSVAVTPPDVERVRGVVAQGGMFVAVGSRVGPRGRPLPLWLYSVDGATWAEGAGPAADVAGAVHSVTAVGDGYASVGAVVDGSGTGRAAAWTSADGRTWRSSPDVPVAPPGGELHGVCGGGDRLYAVGMARDAGRDRPLVWLSGDRGRTWSDAGGAAPLRTPRNAVAFACAAKGDEVVVAGDVGSYGDEAGKDALVWRSADAGRSWQSVELDADPRSRGDQELRGVVDAGDRWVVVGYTGESDIHGDLAVWESVDGAHWTRDPAVERLGSGEGVGEATTVAAFGNAVWIGGSDLDRAQLWVSQP